MSARPPARLGVAASSDFPELDSGWPELRSALIDSGLDPSVIVWDGDDQGDDRFDLVLVNYCWGYVARRAAFLTWAGHMAERSTARPGLVNPLPALRWNSDKTYLADLAAAGVPIVPTTFVAPGQAWLTPAQDYVVKPAGGSGGWLAARYVESATQVAQRHVATLHEAGQTALVQPYQSAVDGSGETAMVFFGNRFSHAVHKAALLDADAGVTDALWQREVITATVASDAHLEVAVEALAATTELVGPMTYARIDVVDGNGGTPVVMEVELIEPSLFLPTAPGAAARFAELLAELVAG